EEAGGLLGLPDQTRDGAAPAGDAPPDHGLAIGPGQRQVVLEHLAGRLLHLVSGDAQRHARVAAGAVEPVDVLAQLEGPPAEGARRVVDGIAVLHAAVEDGDRRLALRNERAVEIDHALLHRCLLWAGLRGALNAERSSRKCAWRRQSKPARAAGASSRRFEPVREEPTR